MTNKKLIIIIIFIIAIVLVKCQFSTSFILIIFDINEICSNEACICTEISWNHRTILARKEGFTRCRLAMN